MAFFPQLPSYSKSVLNTQVFHGLNRGLSIGDGEMADMYGLTSDYYPVLSSADPRGMKTWAYDENAEHVAQFATEPSGILGTDRLIVCHEDKVYMDGVEMPLKLSADEHMKPKHLVSMGAYVCIWPDKVYFNVTNPDDHGDMGRSWSAEAGDVVTAMMCRKDGTNYDEESITISDTAPAEPEDKQLWMDTSGENDVLKQYSEMYDEWIQVATTYIKLQAAGIGKGLKEADVVHIAGARAAAVTGGSEASETLSFATEDFFLYSSFSTNDQGVSTAANMAERTKTITVEGIPEGAVVKNAVLKMKTGSSMYGAQVLTVNNESIAEASDVELPVEVSGNGEQSFLFRFRSNNSAATGGEHSGTVTFKDIVLEVTYEVQGSGNDEKTDLDFLNTTNIVYGCGEDYIIVAGLLRRSVTLADGLKVELKVPDLDYICEANNRIWGCSYANVDGTLTNEIRCCALGDFRNWYRFEGTSMDSYVMSVGSEGKFTGAFSLQGTPLMFKDGYLHKISGTQPSNFTLNTIKCRGVQDGSWRSLAVVGEILFWNSSAGVMAYDGAPPYAVSEKLGTERYYDAVAGAYRNKYYINMRDAGMKYSTYVFDTAKGLWHKEDEARVPLMAAVGDDLIIVKPGTMYFMESVANVEKQWSLPVWMAKFGIFGFAYEQKKYLSRFNIRMQLGKNSLMKVEIMYDSDGIWHEMGNIQTQQLNTFLLPIIPRRCDHCQLRVSGYGDMKIYSIAREFEQGGDG